jgi:hypothetical protein
MVLIPLLLASRAPTFAAFPGQNVKQLEHQDHQDRQAQRKVVYEGERQVCNQPTYWRRVKSG